jgi:hypothetical protein
VRTSPARASSQQEQQASPARSAAVLRYLTNSQARSAVKLAHLRPPQALWIGVRTSPARASSQQEPQASPARSAAVLRSLASSQARSAVKLAHLRPLRALWIGVRTSPTRVLPRTQQEWQAGFAEEHSRLALPPGALSSGVLQSARTHPALPASAGARTSLLARTRARARPAALPAHSSPMSSAQRQVPQIEELHRSPSPRRFAQADLAGLVDRCHGRASAEPAAGPERSAALSRPPTGWDPPRLEQSWQVAERVSRRCSGLDPGPHSALASHLPPPVWRSDRRWSRTPPASPRRASRYLCRSHQLRQPAPGPRQSRQPAVLQALPSHLGRARAQSRAPAQRVPGLAERLQPARTGPRQADLERSDPA